MVPTSAALRFVRLLRLATRTLVIGVDTPTVPTDAALRLVRLLQLTTRTFVTRVSRRNLLFPTHTTLILVRHLPFPAPA